MVVCDQETGLVCPVRNDKVVKAHCAMCASNLHMFTLYTPVEQLVGSVCKAALVCTQQLMLQGCKDAAFALHVRMHLKFADTLVSCAA